MTTTTTTNDSLTVPLLIGSDLASIHRSTGPLRRALAELPGWREAVGHLIHLHSIRPPQRNLASLDLEMEVFLTALAVNRAPFDVDAALEHAAEVQNNLNAHQALARGFERAQAVYVQQLDAVVRQHAGDLYQHLSGQLTAIVDRSRDVADAFSLDAQSALATDAVDEWRAAQQIRGEVAAIRADRGRLQERLGWNVQHPGFAELRWLANPAEVFEHWRAWKVDGALVNPRDLSDRKPLTSPWPDHRDRSTTEEEVSGWIDFFARTPAAVPWVPSPREYDKAAAELGEYAAGLRPARPSRARIELPDEPTTYTENTRPTPRKARTR